MQELAFQVHYQYLLSQYWMNDAYISYVAKTNNQPASALYPTKIELEKQMRDLQNMYPEYYANWLKEHEMRERKTRTNVIEK
jgi:hypothetical protein